MTLCDSEDNDACCLMEMDIQGKSDRRKGGLDEYVHPSVLGPCLETKLTGSSIYVTPKLFGNDGWFIEWIIVRTLGGKTFKCDSGSIISLDQSY